MSILHVWLVVLLACLCAEQVSVKEAWLLPASLRMGCSLLACCSGVVLLVPPLSPWYVLAVLWLAGELGVWVGSAVAVFGGVAVGGVCCVVLLALCMLAPKLATLPPSWVAATP